MGELQIPYMLCKFAFPLLKYEGWVGLTDVQAKAKNKAEFCPELRAHWKQLRVQQKQPGTEGVSLSKEKWCDVLYFKAQDICFADTLRPNRAVHRLAVMGFVRTTCVRSGSMARDCSTGKA